MARIKVIQPDEADGRLREIYEDIIGKRGKLAEVHKIQSLRPESIVNHMDLYMEIMFTSELTLHPGSFQDDSMIDKLRETGLTDNAILDATLVVSYFNFVNRIVLSLGVESNNDELKGYNF